MSLTLLHNVHLLDVRTGQLRPDAQVLIEGDTVREVSDRPLRASSARRIDGGGRTLMPGLIDCHVHVTFSQANLGLLAEPPSIDKSEVTDKGSINQRAVLKHRDALVNALHDGSAPNIILPKATA